MILLLLSSLLHITTCTVYTVTPDDHYYPNTICHHCHNLQHYLLNVTKYFTSNTQLLFLPGLHHLYTDLIIQNVHNISLIGSTANGTTLDTVIQCNSSVGIIMTNITDLTMKNMVIKGCIRKLVGPYGAAVTLENCVNVVLCYLEAYIKFYDESYLPFLGMNILGKSRFSHISCNKLHFIYNEIHAKNVSNTLLIDHLQLVGYVESTYIEFLMYQHSYEMEIQLTHITFQQQYTQFLHGFLRNCILFIVDCELFSNRYHLIEMLGINDNSSMVVINCKFMKTVKSDSVINTRSVNVIINNCIFNGSSTRLKLTGYPYLNGRITVVVKNTQFIDSILLHSVVKSSLDISYANLLLEGLVTFHNITDYDSIITIKDDSSITIHGTIEFSNNSGYQLITFDHNDNQYIKIKEPSIISIRHNQLCKYFAMSPCKILYPFCIFQYFSNRTVEQSKFSMMFYDNQYKENCKVNHKSCHLPIITNCYWLPKSTFSHMITTDVNNWFIKYNNNSIKVNNDHNMLCACNNQMKHDCRINDLGYLYPGEALAIFLYNKNEESNLSSTEVTVKSDISEPHTKPCVVLNFFEHSQLIDDNHCSELIYSSLEFSYGDWCVLVLKVADDYNKKFFITKLNCPPGFVEIYKICKCDPIIVNYGIANCDINNQTVLRPANTWIIATTQIPYSYYITEHCRFYYCLPHSSHLNLFTPNTQCQFNRSGLLCGHCQQGLSTVFSSSQCQHCSNVYLFLIIPIAISGLLLVILLFILNTTITDGNINGFILFVNIISINSSYIFSRMHSFTPAYTFISLANLDLGIQTCFYNGMDDYAKMWLQLAFPFYLIFIATLIIIKSRYSTTIQRLTAHRALPVLATLFLLSYTKILRIVSSVLFSYSTITHLPSKHTTLVWSVDANVPLFGIRFTILFIVCLILFLILVPFNVILLFTRTLSRFQFITKFKPLLDAYQGPYKDRYYYWTGLQLVVRAMLLTTSSLDRNNNLTIGIIIFSIFGGIHGLVQPLKSTIQNHQELLFILYLHGIYAVALNSQDTTNMTVVNIIIMMVAFQFCIIIAYHIITYMCGVQNLPTKIMTSVKTITKWITRSFGISQQEHFQLQDTTRNKIPKVAFNYYEYREPLVGED